MVFQTKHTWIKATRKGNYLYQNLINVKKVNKFSPESKETQKVHTRGHRQGARSTKPATEEEDEEEGKY